MENTKDMKKDVLITIKGTQKIGNEKDVIEMVTTGRFLPQKSDVLHQLRGDRGNRL